MKRYFFWILLGIYLNCQHGFASDPEPELELTTVTEVTTEDDTATPPEATTIEDDHNVTEIEYNKTETTTIKSDTTSTIDICEPCRNGACENTNTEIYQCVCEDGWHGIHCDMSSVCEETFEISSINNTGTSCNGNETGIDFIITFVETEAGKSSSSMENCTTCEDNTVPVALKKCVIAEDGNAHWESDVTIVDCSKEFDDKTSAEKVEYLASSTADPSETTSDDVEFAVEGLETEAAKANISQSTADNVVLTINNLLLVENPDAEKSVQESSESMLNIVDDVSDNVLLTTNADGYSSYDEVQSSLALAVVEDSASSRRKRAVYSTGQVFYYGTDDSLVGNNENLAIISPFLSKEEPTGIYMKSASNGKRTSFKVYSLSDSFVVLNSSIQIGRIVFSVNGSSDFTLHFETDRELSVAADGRFDSSRKVNCARLNRTDSQWRDGGCSSYSSTGTFASCVCKQPGEYIIRTVIDLEPTDEGLSGGAIAGIVVGSIAVVALVAGLIYYCCTKSNKKNTVQPDAPVQMSHASVREAGNESRNSNRSGSVDSGAN